MPDKLLDSNEACDFLKISKHRLYELVAVKKIPLHRIGGKLIFSQNEIYEWVMNGGAEDEQSFGKNSLQ